MRIPLYLMALLLIAALTACPAAPTSDTTPPTIVSSIPANDATGVASSASVAVVYSEAMNPNALTVTVTPSIDLGTPVWSDSRTALLTPKSTWKAGQRYNVQLSGTDVAGNTLTGTKTIAFEIAVAPDTTAPATPTGLKATAGEGSFALEWDANAETDLSGYTVYWGDTEATLLGAQFIAAPTRTITVTGLENARAYYYAVDARDTTGNASVQSLAAAVTPRDVTAPSLASSEPANGAVEIALVPSLRFAFSEPMNTGSLEVGICVKTDPPATAVCDVPSLAGLGMPTWTEGDTVAQFAPPNTAFPAGKTYVLKPNGKDKAGNALPSATRVAFATRATPDTTAPLLNSSSSDASTPNVKLSFTFSEPMDQVSVQNAFLSQPPIKCLWTWQGNVANCVSSLPLEQLTNYTVIFGTGAKDTAQNPLAAATSPTAFTTPDFAPRVVKAVPANGAFNVGIKSLITLTFSEPMNRSSLANGFTVVVAGKLSQLVAGTQFWDSSNTVLTFTPNASYGYGRTVTWSLTAAVKDAGGKALANAVSGSFRTQLQIAGRP